MNITVHKILTFDTINTYTRSGISRTLGVYADSVILAGVATFMWRCKVLLQDYQHPEPPLTLVSKQIIVENFVYLGSYVSAGGGECEVN